MSITIYSINHQNKPIYIGQTQKTVEGRWSDHKSRAKTEPKRGEKLYNKIRKYGIENFTIQPLCVVTEEQADYTEIKLIEVYDTIKNGCNLAIGGRVNRGMKRTPEQCKTYSKLRKEEYKKGNNPLAKWNGSPEQKTFLKEKFKDRPITWGDEISKAKSQGPYYILMNDFQYYWEGGLNGFAKKHNLNARSLKLSLKNNKPTTTKGHIVSVSKV